MCICSVIPKSERPFDKRCANSRHFMSLTPQPELPLAEVSPAEESRFLVEVTGELDLATIERRAKAVNVLLRVSTMNGMQMQLGATLNLLCEMAAEVARFDVGVVYFWNEASERPELRSFCGLLTNNVNREQLAQGNVLSFWSMKHGQPMIAAPGIHPQADELLTQMAARSAVMVPLLMNNRVMGSMQFFSSEENAFSREDAQLLWMLSRVAENVLSREFKSEGLLQFAFTDHLTGLKTRGYFEQQLELEIKRFERSGQPLTLLMLDIDYFKILNDTYGHRTGDRVLRQVANVLTEDMREIDTVARYGGEEFAIILPDTKESEALLVAERIRSSVEKRDFGVPSPNPGERISISIGLAVLDKDAKTKRDLIEFADTALYFAKGHGRNRVITYAEFSRRKQAS